MPMPDVPPVQDPPGLKSEEVKETKTMPSRYNSSCVLVVKVVYSSR